MSNPSKKRRLPEDKQVPQEEASTERRVAGDVSRGSSHFSILDGGFPEVPSVELRTFRRHFQFNKQGGGARVDGNLSLAPLSPSPLLHVPRPVPHGESLGHRHGAVTKTERILKHLPTPLEPFLPALTFQSGEGPSGLAYGRNMAPRELFPRLPHGPLPQIPLHESSRRVAEQQHLPALRIEVTPFATPTEENPPGLASLIPRGSPRDELASRILESLGPAIYCFSTTGIITFWNKSSERMFGHTEHQALGRNIVQLLCSRDFCEEAYQIVRDLSLGHSWFGVLPLRTRDGRVFEAAMSNTPIFDKEGRLESILGVVSEARLFSPTLSLPRNLPSFATHHNHFGGVQNQAWANPMPGQPASWPIGSNSRPSSALNACTPEAMGRSIPSHALNACSPQAVGMSSDDAAMMILSSFETVGMSSSDLALIPAACMQRNATWPRDGCPSSSPSGVATQTRLRGSGLVCQRSASLVANLLPQASWQDPVGQALGLPSLGCPPPKAVSSEEAANGETARGGTCLGFPIIQAAPAHGITPDRMGHQQSFAAHSALSPALGRGTLGRGMAGGCPGRSEGFDCATDCASAGEEEEAQARNSLVPLGDFPGSFQGQRHRWLIEWSEIEVGPLVGEGVSGAVYRAKWRGVDVAVKVFSQHISSEFSRRDFEKEVSIMETLRHPNILLFMGAVETPERTCIISEFVPRGSLLRVLHQGSTQTLPLLRRLQMALDAAKGVHYLHSCSPPVIHHDLKSANLLVDRDWRVKVADFGLSKLKLTSLMSVKSGGGTPQWMAPEVLRSEHSSEKSDVFSFGVILWELCTMKTPWEGLNPMQVVGAVGFKNERLEIPCDLDPRVQDLIASCWKSDPELRPSFSEIMQRLSDMLKTFRGSIAQAVDVALQDTHDQKGTWKLPL